MNKIIDLKTIPSTTIVEKQEKPKAKDLSNYTPGHWEFICSECHTSIGVVEGGTLDGGLFRFCPNCGAEIER